MSFLFHNSEPDHHPNPWVTLSESTAYENPWVRVSHREVLNPGGGKGIYGVVHYKNIAVGVLPLDEQGYTWLVGQYRYTLQRYSWEIPEGGCPKGTDTLATAQRELLEETGITAKKWTPLLETHLSNSVSDEYGVGFVAQVLQFGSAQPEESEALQLRKVHFFQALDMVMQGQITDALAMLCILKTHQWLQQGILQF